MTTTHGIIYWNELRTTDLEGAKAFYSGLFGWNLATSSMEGIGEYVTCSVGDHAIAGLMGLQAEGNVHSYWLSYVSVDDVDATIATAAEHGAKVAGPVLELDGIGRFATIIDAQGALIALLKPEIPDGPPEARPADGEFCWYRLSSLDTAASKALYEDIFGWTLAEVDMGGPAPFSLFKRGEQDIAEMVAAEEGAGHPAYWMVTVAVPDAKRAVEKATSLGGAVVLPPMAIPNVGTMAVLRDPAGSVFAVFEAKAEWRD